MARGRREGFTSLCQFWITGLNLISAVEGMREGMVEGMLEGSNRGGSHKINECPPGFSYFLCLDRLSIK